MAIAAKPGQSVRVTIKTNIKRASARKTIERLFMTDKKHSQPLAVRSKNFVAIPKRRGGTIWTKRPNKIHPPLNKGDVATVKVTPQFIKDLNSVEDVVEVTAA